MTDTCAGKAAVFFVVFCHCIKIFGGTNYFKHDYSLIDALIDSPTKHTLHITRDGRISDPAIRMWSDFHYPAKSDSSQIACFTPDQTDANYCVNINQTICQCSLSTV